MVDRISEEKRSWNMSRIRSTNTQPEMVVRSFLHRKGFRFRLHQKNVFGKPDIILKKYKTAIFIDGCFWHRHKDCRFAYTPKSRINFWNEKFESNILLNPSKNYDSGMYNINNFAMVGGMSKNSSFAKTLYNLVGYNPLTKEQRESAVLDNFNEMDKIQMLDKLSKFDCVLHSSFIIMINNLVYSNIQ